MKVLNLKDFVKNHDFEWRFEKFYTWDFIGNFKREKCSFCGCDTFCLYIVKERKLKAYCESCGTRDCLENFSFIFLNKKRSEFEKK